MLSYFVENVGLAGVEKLRGRKRFYSVFWLLLILAGAAFCGYHLHDRITYFLSNPVVVNIKLEHTEETNAVFPIVDICTELENGFWNQSKCGSWFASMIDHEGDKLENVQNILSNCSAVDFSSREWISQFVRAYTKPVKQIARECLFDRAKCSEDAIVPYGDMRGVCYRFNGDGQARSALFGIRAHLDVTFVDETDNFWNKGFFVAIYTPGRPGFDALAPIFVPAGMHTNIAIRRYKTIALPSPYPSNCTDYEPSTNALGANTQENCLTRCRFMLTDKEAGCHFEWPNTTAYWDRQLPPFCSLSQLTNWLQMEVKHWKTNSEECVKHCPDACSEVTYKVRTVSNTVFGDPSSHDYNEEKYGEPRNVARLRVYLEGSKTNVIQQVPAYTWLAFMSDIGGAISLSLGACLLTVMQLLDAAGVVLFRQVSQRKNRVVEIRNN